MRYNLRILQVVYACYEGADPHYYLYDYSGASRYATDGVRLCVFLTGK